MVMFREHEHIRLNVFALCQDSRFSHIVSLERESERTNGRRRIDQKNGRTFTHTHQPMMKWPQPKAIEFMTIKVKHDFNTYTIIIFTQTFCSFSLTFSLSPSLKRTCESPFQYVYQDGSIYMATKRVTAVCMYTILLS